MVSSILFKVVFVWLVEGNLSIIGRLAFTHNLQIASACSNACARCQSVWAVLLRGFALLRPPGMACPDVTINGDCVPVQIANNNWIGRDTMTDCRV